MKKSQIKMFETIAVLIIFFFFLVASAAVYFQLQKGSTKRLMQKMTEQESLQLAHRTMTLPELDCSFASVQKENCFDAYKLTIFSELLKQEQTLPDYFPLFGYSELIITTIYPETSQHVLYTNKPATFHTKLITQNPILIYNATTNTYTFATLEVRSYVQ